MLRRPPPNRPGPPTADTLPTHDDNSPGGLHGLNLDAKDDDGFEERWARPQVSQANTPKVIVGTSHSHTNIDVYLNTFSDGNWLGATVNIYAKTMNGRALVSTATTANPPLDAQTQRFTASGAASEGFDVEVILATPSSTTAAVTAIAYGWEGNCCTGGSTGGITQLTNQVIAGPGSGSVVAKIAAQETPVAWVSTTGSDVTGNGNLFNPFATYAKASTVLINEYAPTAAAMAVVRFEPGTYLENIALKPNVALSGDPSSQTILSGVMSFDASFTGAGRIGVAFANLAINGGFDADFVGAGASDAFLQYLACAFHTTSYNGGGTSSLSLEVCSFGSDVTFTDMSIASNGTVFPTTTTVVSTVGAEWNSSGDVLQNLTVDGTAAANSIGLYGTPVTGTMSLTGTHCNVLCDVTGLGTSLVLAGGATGPNIVGSAGGLVGQALVANGFGSWEWGSAGGISQLTNDVLAGPGTGSQNSIVQQLTGVGNLVAVVSGTRLSFYTTPETPSANGRINFQGDAAEVWIGYHYNGADHVFLQQDGANTVTMQGATSGGLFVVRGGGNAELSLFGGGGNTVDITAVGGTVNAGKWTHTSTPIFLDASSNLTVGATAADYGGATGVLSFAPAGQPTSLPASQVGLYATTAGQTLGINGQGITFSPYAASVTLTQAQLAAVAGAGDTGDNMALSAQAGQATTGNLNAPGVGGNLTDTAGAGGASTGLNTNGAAGGNYTASGGAGGAAPGATSTGGAGGNAFLMGGAGGVGAGGNGAIGGAAMGAAGQAYLSVGGPGGAGLGIVAQPITTTGGTLTLSQAQYLFGRLGVNGTLASALTIVFPNTTGLWLLDLTGLTTGAFTTITIQSGSASTVITSAGPSAGVGQAHWIVTNGSNTLAII